jgi:hypothetical protein
MLRAWLLERRARRWRRAWAWYRLGVEDARLARAYNPYGAPAARLRAAGVLDGPRHRAGDREPTSPAWEVRVG